MNVVSEACNISWGHTVFFCPEHLCICSISGIWLACPFIKLTVACSLRVDNTDWVYLQLLQIIIFMLLNRIPKYFSWYGEDFSCEQIRIGPLKNERFFLDWSVFFESLCIYVVELSLLGLSIIKKHLEFQVDNKASTLFVNAIVDGCMSPFYFIRMIILDGTFHIMYVYNN